MKIAFLTPEFPHPKTGTSGGIGTSIYNLSKGITQLGHTVFVLVCGQDQDEMFVEDGITYIRIKNIKIKGFSRFLTQLKIEKIINQLVKVEQLELVEVPDWIGITSSIKPKCPVVIRLNGSDTYFCHLDARPVKFLNKWYEKKALQNADAFLSVSQYTADLTKELFRLNVDFEIIPNSIDVTQFSNDSSIVQDENTILYFGTLIRKKGLLELPLIFNEVYKRNNKTKLILIGKDASDVLTQSPSTWKLMQSLFDDEAKQNVSYLGSVAYDKIKKHINASTVCVFPTFAEALPVSWIEAMAMEKAIVASNIGWAVEVINDSENGYLVNPKNHYEYASKILELIENKDKRQQFGLAARKKVEQYFSIEVIAAKSIAFYQNCLSR